MFVETFFIWKNIELYSRLREFVYLGVQSAIDWEFRWQWRFSIVNWRWEAKVWVSNEIRDLSSPCSER